MPIITNGITGTSHCHVIRRANHEGKNRFTHDGVIRLTPTSPPTTDPLPATIPAKRSASARRSSGRNAERPPESATNASSAASLVHAAGSDRARSLPSNHHTRSDPQQFRLSINSNSRPRSGWNGWLTRKVRATPTTSGVFPDFLQRSGREPHQDARGRSGLPDGVRDVRGGLRRPPEVHRHLQHPQTALGARLPKPSSVRGSSSWPPCQNRGPKLSTARGALQEVCSFRLPLPYRPSGPPPERDYRHAADHILQTVSVAGRNHRMAHARASGLLAHVVVQGLTTSTPISLKSRTLRVATTMLRERAIAAI